jgi:hypothetical protein
MGVKMAKSKDINTQRLEAIIEDMKIQVKEMQKISSPKTFKDRLIAFGRHPMMAKQLLYNIEIKHTKKQIAIAVGRFDNKLKTIISGDD